MSNSNKKVIAIILAAGTGKRMGADKPKQYLELKNKPVLYYTLHAFEQSKVDGIVLVTGKGEEQFCREKIVKKYHFSKVQNIVEGGKERYNSVFNGLEACSDAEYVLIHDGARMLVTQDIIERNIETVKQFKACITAVPVKDTIKCVDINGIVKSTPDRRELWQVQTPQSFAYDLIYHAYKTREMNDDKTITDDAMVVEKYTKEKIKIVLGNYYNFKLTTPEDLVLAENILNNIKY